jgi:pyrimidine oxygenase
MAFPDGYPIFGLFMPMANGGWIVSQTTPPIDGLYPLNRRAAIAADGFGFDFIMSMMKWRGFGGATDHWGTTVESIVLMSALSQLTKRVKIWATVHTILQNPVVVAKMIATLDHVSGGRAGLNIVSGAYEAEFDQMGAWRPDLNHDTRYDLAEEWVTVLTRLWAERRVDFAGEHFQIKDCQSDPKPLSRPRPDLICAGTSEVGLRFAARHTDASFVGGTTEEELAFNARRAKAIGREYGKDFKAFAMYMIVPGDTDADAERRVQYYRDGADVQAIANMATGFGRAHDGKEHSIVARARDAFLPSVIAGSPQTLINKIADTIDSAGIDGMMLIFPDYDADLARFGTEVLPALRASPKPIGQAQPA